MNILYKIPCLILLFIFFIAILPAKGETTEEWLKKGNDLYTCGDYKKALECYEQILALEPDSVPALVNKSICLAGIYQLDDWQEDKYREGRQCLDRILKGDPELEKIDVSALYSGNLTLLHMAAYYGNDKVAKVLIEKGADVNAKNAGGLTPLFMPVYFGVFCHISHMTPPEFEIDASAMSSLLINAGADVNIKFFGNRTPLHAVACTGNLNLAKLLISKNADVNAVNDEGKTPLHTAVIYGQDEIVRLLLSGGADVNAKDSEGQAPLHMAELESTGKILIDNKAGLNEKDNNGNTPLHRAKNMDMAKLLILSGSDINARNNSGYTPLYIAVLYGTTQGVTFLLEEGADVNIKDNTGNTPLHRAPEFGNTAIAKLLISGKGDVNPQNLLAFTPLHLAKNADMANLLISSGANTEITGLNGATPLYYALFNGNTEVAKVLLTCGADVNVKGEKGDSLLHLATFYGNIELAKLLISYGLDVNIKDKEGYTPLHYAAVKEQKELGDFYISHRGINNLHWAVINNDIKEAEKFAVENLNKGPWGYSPLHLAAMKGYKAMAELLIKKGANVNSGNDRGLTPLYLAIQEGQTDMVNLLLERGAKVDMRNEYGFSPLHWAVYYCKKDIVEALLLKGADINDKNNDVTNILNVAEENGNTVMADFFLSSIDKDSKNPEGFSPLLISLIVGTCGRINLFTTPDTMIESREILDVLLSDNADVNRGFYKTSPLHFLAFAGDKESALLLIKQGADVNAKDKEGKTPLHIAAERGNRDFALLLLENGADMKSEDNTGKTPLDYVKTEELKEFFEEYGNKN